ncbi:MAG: hypothetical protein WD270_07460 [Acetobacterales bacterium]
MEQMIELPALRRATALAPSAMGPGTRSVEASCSPGARVRRVSLLGEPHDQELGVAPDPLRLRRPTAGTPILKTHEAGDPDAVSGCVARAPCGAV